MSPLKWILRKLNSEPQCVLSISFSPICKLIKEHICKDQLLHWQIIFFYLIFKITDDYFVAGMAFHAISSAAAAKSLQSCPTLCDPIDSSPPGSPVPGILQARTLEWVAISSSSVWKWKVKVKSLSCVRLVGSPWTAAHQAPPSMGFSRQEYWSGVPLPSPVLYVKCLKIIIGQDKGNWKFPATGLSFEHGGQVDLIVMWLWARDWLITSFPETLPSQRFHFGWAFSDFERVMRRC